MFTFGPWPISFWAVSMIRGRHLLKLSIVQKKTKDTTVNMSPSDLPPQYFNMKNFQHIKELKESYGECPPVYPLRVLCDEYFAVFALS